jgi:hypothetical protein
MRGSGSGACELGGSHFRLRSCLVAHGRAGSRQVTRQLAPRRDGVAIEDLQASLVAVRDRGRSAFLRRAARNILVRLPSVTE